MEEQNQKQKHEEALKALETVNEQGGPKGKEPVRYGDWDVDGRLSDF